jgi:hypothetical protein
MVSTNRNPEILRIVDSLSSGEGVWVGGQSEADNLPVTAAILEPKAQTVKTDNICNRLQVIATSVRLVFPPTDTTHPLHKQVAPLKVEEYFFLANLPSGAGCDALPLFG